MNVVPPSPVSQEEEEEEPLAAPPAPARGRAHHRWAAAPARRPRCWTAAAGGLTRPQSPPGALET